MRRERQGVAPLAGGVDESGEDDDDDGRADESGEIRIDTLESELGEDGGQRRKDRGPERPVEPLCTGHARQTYRQPAGAVSNRRRRIRRRSSAPRSAPPGRRPAPT